METGKRIEVFFVAFAKASNDVFLYMGDFQNNTTKWSANCVDYFDLPGDVISIDFWRTRIHPHDLNAYLSDLRDVRNHKHEMHDCEYRALNKYGEYVWLQCKGTLVKDEQGNERYLVGMMHKLSVDSKYDSVTDLKTIYEFYKLDLFAQEGAILLIGLDHFRTVINNYGYTKGNSILHSFARILQDTCKELPIFRFTGDEFIVVIPRATTEKEVVHIYHRIKEELEKREESDPDRYNSVTFSTGALFYPRDGEKQATLIANLEHSLEYVKEHNRHHLAFFSDKIATQHKRTLELRNALSKSLNNNFEGFRLVYQPILREGSRKLYAFESLCRFQTEEFPHVSPLEFIKMLEESGDITRLGIFVMKEALRQGKIWQQYKKDLVIGFNVSYIQFMDPVFIEALFEEQEKQGIRPQSIALELTESMQIENPLALKKVVSHLREHGFRVSFDDFGTAYATLGLIRTLQVDSLKIDQSFIKELASPDNIVDLAIIDSIQALAKRLDIQIIVEGVENKVLDDIVSHLDIDFVQGYYYAMPLEADEFGKFMKENVDPNI